MSKKKGKFDLTKLVREGILNEGQKFYFVSDPSKLFVVCKQPNGEYKIQTEEGVTTVHAFAQQCLGTEPPNHATHWFKNDSGKTLFELWDQYETMREAA